MKRVLYILPCLLFTLFSLTVFIIDRAVPGASKGIEGAFRPDFYLFERPFITLTGAVGMLILCFLVRGKGRWIMLAGYVIFILMMTILYREGKGTPGYNFDPALLFHRFGADAFSRKEIIFNVWLFIPFGALLGRLSRKPWILLIILGTTILIEGSQYLFHIGFCDICDVINNALGGILGFLAVGAMGVKVAGNKNE